MVKKILNKIAAFLAKKRQQEVDKREVITALEDMLEEFKLIKEKKSSLSRSRRDEIEKKVNELIVKGLIVNNNGVNG